MKDIRYGYCVGGKGAGLLDENRALTLGSSIDGIGRVTSREDVFAEIQKLLDSCYRFGVNPLPGLRQSFPDYEWGFEDFGNRHHISFYSGVSGALKDADFLWSPWDWLGSSVVWARRKISEQNPLGICATKHDSRFLSDKTLEEILGESNILRY